MFWMLIGCVASSGDSGVADPVGLDDGAWAVIGEPDDCYRLADTGVATYGGEVIGGWDLLDYEWAEHGYDVWSYEVAGEEWDAVSFGAPENRTWWLMNLGVTLYRCPSS